MCIFNELQTMTQEYSSCFLHFNKAWSSVSAQNICSSNPSSRQSILTRTQLKLDEGAFSTNMCGFHKKKWIPAMLKAGFITH